MTEHLTGTKCHACGGGGFLSYHQFDSKLNCEYEFIARCGHCENWLDKVGPNNIIPRYTMAEIIVKGGRLLSECGRCFSQNKNKRKTIKKRRENSLALKLKKEIPIDGMFKSKKKRFNPKPNVINLRHIKTS